MAEPCLKSHHCTAPATAVGLQNWVLANWNYTLFTPAENQDMSLAPSNSKFYWLITKNDRGTERETLSQDSPPSLANSFCNGNTDREESDHCRSPFSLPFSHPFSKTGQWYQRTGNYLSLQLFLYRSRRISYLLKLKSHNLWNLKPETELDW